MKKSILISIKPKYCDLIFSGRKTVELRRVFSRDLIVGGEMILYATAPVSAIVGYTYVGCVEKKWLPCLKALYRRRAMVSFEEFAEYFKGKKVGYGIPLVYKHAFQRPFRLASIRRRIADFRPPQNFCYTKNELESAIADHLIRTRNEE